MTKRLQLAIIRHGQTPGNGQHRYVGALDQPLSDEGRAQARARRPFVQRALPPVTRVYVSTLSRTGETAALLFPGAEQVVVEGIQEMDFGDFAGRSADEMADDAAYREWVAGNCEGCCPNGEAKEPFTERICEAMERTLRQCAARGEYLVVMVAHGGTMMASLSRFAVQRRLYHEWLVGNCEGYLIDVELDVDALSFVKVQLLQER